VPSRSPMSNPAPIDLAPMPRAYTSLLRRATEVFEADDRVRALWMHGAVERGAQDAGSDLDLNITVAAAALEEMTQQHEDWIAQITDWVSLQQMGAGPGWYALTPTCERVDFLLESVDELPSTPHRRRLLVFDKDDLSQALPPAADPPPDPTSMEFFIREPLRQMANFPIIFIREDWLMGVVAVQQIHQYLYLLFAEENKPQPPTGPKQWSHKLSATRRHQLKLLPVPQPDPVSIRECWKQAVALLLSEAPPIAAHHGVEWPIHLEHAVLTYLRGAGYPPTP